jgi:hydrogenase maturation protein HypF
VAHLRTFPLPGGEKAIKEPRRCALGLLYEMEGKSVFARTGLPLQAFAAAELKALEGVLARAVNSPRTSSAGRLFDAVASLAGLCQHVRYEGQAAMELEFALRHTVESAAYPLQLVQPPTVAPGPDGPAVGPVILDWTPMVEAVLADVSAGVPVGTISARFHNGLVEGIIAVAQLFGIEAVALSGGCYQNRYLTERTIHRLQEARFRPYWHQRVPPNDGGIALGQVMAGVKRDA